MDGIFGIGFPELVMIAIIALIVLGPERLPGTIREVAKFIRQARAVLNDLTSQFGDEFKVLEDLNPRKLINEMTDPLNAELDNKPKAAKSTTANTTKPVTTSAKSSTPNTSTSTAKTTTSKPATPTSTTSATAAEPTTTTTATSTTSDAVVESTTSEVENKIAPSATDTRSEKVESAKVETAAAVAANSELSVNASSLNGHSENAHSENVHSEEEKVL